MFGNHAKAALVGILTLAGSLAGSPAWAQPRFQATEVSLRVERIEREAPDRAKVHFVGTIRTNGAGTIQYKFLRSDGANAPVQTLRFDRAESKEVRTTWTLSKDYHGWEALQVTHPLPIASGRASFSVDVGRFEVTHVNLRADHPSSSGAGSVPVQFHGHITVNGPGTVRYSFVRSDGASGPVLSMTFDRAGTREVETSWTLGRDYAGWIAIRVLSPNVVESDHAGFRVDIR